MSNTELKTDFIDLMRLVSENKYLLPDFQREFVWKDEDQQKSIAASVLSKMPIGSILLIESNPNEYVCKLIGSKNELQLQTGSQPMVNFVLDGQQRITVLTNVFSNIIHKITTSVSELAGGQSLKRRFFLKIPKWNYVHTNQDLTQDLFNIQKLKFPMEDPETGIPEFLSGDIKSCIEVVTFTASDNKPYNPLHQLDQDLDNYCIHNPDVDYYLIPLFLMSQHGYNNPGQVKMRMNHITTDLSSSISTEISDYFYSLDDRKQVDFIDDFFAEEGGFDAVVADVDDFIKQKAQIWVSQLNKYLESCLRNCLLNRIEVKNQERARAIDIYENMNKGGVSLDTFDLITAKVAKVNKTPFMGRIVNEIEKPRTYDSNFIETSGVRAEFVSLISTNSYTSASLFSKCYSKENKELNKIYEESFLNTMSLYCYNPGYNADDYKVEYTKKNKILDISPELIDKNTEKICNAVDRALFFFQTRCGILEIKEIHYSLMLTAVSVIFTNDEWYKNKKVHDLLEAWYWTCVFSGEYDKDQNVVNIRNIASLIKTIKNDDSTSWIKTKVDSDVFNATYFSDKQTLCLERINEDRLPKDHLKHDVCRYYLSKSYCSLFDSSKTISVFSESREKLEAHHIIPLGTAVTYGESTKSLRADHCQVLNSPMNFIYITKDDNLIISDKSPKDYFKMINDEGRSALQLAESLENVNEKTFVSNRFTFLSGEVKTEIKTLLNSVGQSI